MPPPTLTRPAVLYISRWRRVHFASGLVLAAFVGTHLLNHLVAGLSPAAHLEFMRLARLVYRHPVVETVLLGAVLLQIGTGLRLAKSGGVPRDGWRRLHVGSGLYLAFFLLVHVGAVLTGRYLLRLDTNLYFGAAGINRFPYNLFFVPYYGLAMGAFFTHVAPIHQQKMRRRVAGLSVEQQARLILVLGILVTLGVFFGVTDRFRGLAIPAAYRVLTP